MTDRDHPLDVATRLTPIADGVYRGHTAPAYWNMAGPFGGVTAAIIMRAVIERSDRQGTPVAITTSFLAPVAEGPFDIRVNLQAGGRHVQHWAVEMWQGERLMTSASVITGRRNQSWAHQVEDRPNAPAPETVPPLATEGRSDWLQNYRFQMLAGDIISSSGSDDSPGDAHSQLWISDWPKRCLDFVSLAAISDTFFLRLLQIRGSMVPMGTVTLTTYFHATEDELAAQGDTPLLGEASAERINANFHDQRARLWSKGGVLLASGVQLVWFRE